MEHHMGLQQTDLQQLIEKIQNSCISEETGLVDFDRLSAVLPADLALETVEAIIDYLYDTGMILEGHSAPQERSQDDVLEVDFTNALAGYVLEVQNLGRLGRSDEDALIAEWESLRSADREKVIHAYLPMVLNLARQKGQRRDEILELIQEGNIALLAAARSFQPGGSRTFRDFVRWKVQKAMSKWHEENSQVRQIPDQLMAFFRQFKQVGDAMRQRLQRQPSVDEIAISMEIPLETVLRNLSLASNLSDPDSSVDEGDQAFIHHVREVTQNREMDPRRHTALRTMILDNLELLSPVEKEIVTLYYDLNDSGQEMDFFEIAELLGLKTKMVSDLETAAMMKIMGPGA
jgi:RNA polymerase primary sigma factor